MSKVKIGVTSTPVKVLNFDDIIVGPTVRDLIDAGYLVGPYPEHSCIEAEGLADDEISNMKNYNEEWRTKIRGTNDQEYQIYLDITNNNEPLKTYEEWLQS